MDSTRIHQEFGPDGGLELDRSRRRSRRRARSRGPLRGPRAQRALARRASDGVRFVPHYLDANAADELFAILEAMPGWHQDYVQIYGKTHPLPRLHRWFADSDQPYRWSGIDMHPEPFPDALRGIAQKLKDESGVKFNTALGNLYRNGSDGVSWHSDDERDLGPDPVIASLSPWRDSSVPSAEES